MPSTVSAFVRFVKDSRGRRAWNIAELARRAGLTQPELSRVESGQRKPTLRHVKGLSEAFSTYPVEGSLEPEGSAKWWQRLGNLAEQARTDARAASTSA
tara:strand:+ start:118 stop:414 length:297 start_codon:yes stop_codon:yes gene_type:complete